jgi:hypothetical protein
MQTPVKKCISYSGYNMRAVWIFAILGLGVVLLAIRRPKSQASMDGPEPDVSERVNIDSFPYEFGRNLSNDTCPYCGIQFAKPPIRSRKCPGCKNRVERVSVGGGQKALVTMAESEKYWAARAAEFSRRMRENNLRLFQNTKERARYIGSRAYIWQSAGDSSVCAICAQNNGKTFSWNQAPEHGHAGTCDACTEGYCRCWCEVIFSD